MKAVFYDFCEGEKEKAVLIDNRVLFFKKDESLPDKLVKKIKEEGVELPGWKFGELDLLFFEITSNCNYKCVHCYNEPFRKNSHTISLDNFKKALENISSAYHKINLIQITGGEPFLVEGLENYVGHALKKAEKVQIFSNGSLIRDIERFEKFRGKLTFRISFYSIFKEEYEKITRNGLFEKTLDNILKLKRKGFNVHVEIPIITEINGQSHRKTIDFFEKRGIKTKSSYVIGYGNALSLEKKRIKGVRLPKDIMQRWRISKKYDNCWATHIAINQDGDVFPCIFAREYKIGNILKEESEEIKRKHEELAEKYKPNNLEKCKTCELKYLCHSCLPRAKTFGFEGIKQTHCPK